MNFERAANSEKSVRLILESVAEQLADDLRSEIIILSSEVESFIFQPYIIPENNPAQRIGPTEGFSESFIKNMIARLEAMHPDVNWKDGLKTQTSPEGIVTIRVSYSNLNNYEL